MNLGLGGDALGNHTPQPSFRKTYLNDPSKSVHSENWIQKNIVSFINSSFLFVAIQIIDLIFSSYSNAKFL